MWETLEQVKKDVGSWFSVSTENFKNHVSKWVSHGRMGGLLDYRSDEFRELIRLKEQHQGFFSEQDKAIEGIAKTKEGKPIGILDIDWDKQKPTVQEHEILMCFHYDRKRNEEGFLNKEMRTLSNLIKACVNVRFAAYQTLGYNHVNGAVILFCAEFAKWVNDTAKRQADEKLVAELKERIDYLSVIEEERIFEHEPKADYAVNLLIFNLQQILEKGALPCLQAHLNCQASRELFGSLKKHADSFYENATKGLFYLYTHDTQCQDIFELEFDDEIISEAKDKLMATPLGQQFKQLEKSRQKVARLDYKSSKIKMIAENTFLTQNGEAAPLLIADLILGSEQSGVHPLLQKEAATMRCLVKSLGLLQDFTYFISAFSQGFSLAGAGGDILMYIGLCAQTTALIQCYCEIHERLMQQFAELQKLADGIKYNLMKQQEYNHSWIRNYQRSKRYLREAKEHLIFCHQTLQKMAIQMQNVHSHDYANKIRNQMEWFHQTIELIAQRFGKTAAPAMQETIITQPDLPAASISPSSLPVAPHKSIEERTQEALRATEVLLGYSIFSPPKTPVAPAILPLEQKDTLQNTKVQKEEAKLQKPEKSLGIEKK